MNMVLFVKEIINYIDSLSTMDILFMGSSIVLMLLLVTFIYVLKIDDKEPLLEDNSDISLDALTKKMTDNISTNVFEVKEETKAIISYDELVNTASIPVIKYKEEEDLDGLLVKAIDVNNLIETMDPKPITHPATYNVNKGHNAISKIKKQNSL